MQGMNEAKALIAVTKHKMCSCSAFSVGSFQNYRSLYLTPWDSDSVDLFTFLQDSPSHLEDLSGLRAADV